MTGLDCGAECFSWRNVFDIRGACCPESRGRMVGRFFVVVDGCPVFKPRDRKIQEAGLWNVDLPVWVRPEGPLRNTEDLWCCEACDKLYPTTLGPYRGCVGLGSSTPITRPGGGECYAR